MGLVEGMGFTDEQREMIVQAEKNDPLVAATLARDWEPVTPNPSGIYPTEFKVLVLPNPVEETTKGGIIIPDQTKERLQYAEMEGRMIAAAPAAFSFIEEREHNGQKPVPGDRVIIAKYAGVRVKGDDGVEYVLVNDKDIAAVRK